MGSRDPARARSSRPGRRAHRRRTRAPGRSRSPRRGRCRSWRRRWVSPRTRGARPPPAPPAPRPVRPPATGAASARTRRSRPAGPPRATTKLHASQLIPRLRQRRRALLGRDHAGQVEHASYLGGEVPAAGEDLPDRPVGDHGHRRRAAPPARRRPAANSTSWVATITAAPRDAKSPISATRLVAPGPVHSPGRLVEGDQPGHHRAGDATGQRDRQRQAAAAHLQRGHAGPRLRRAPGRSDPTPPALLRRQLVTDPLANQVVARTLREKRHLPADLDPTPHRFDQARRRSGATCSSRPRSVPSAPPAHPVCTDRSIPCRTSRRLISGVQLHPHVPRRHGSRRARGVPDPSPAHFARAAWRVSAFGGARECECSGGTPTPPGTRPVAERIWRASRTPTGIGSMPGEGEEPGRRSRQRPARRPSPRRGTPPGAPSKEIVPESIAITRSAAARQRSRRCSAESTATPHSSLRRRSSQTSSSPATGSSCEVGSSRSTSEGG